MLQQKFEPLTSHLRNNDLATGLPALPRIKPETFTLWMIVVANSVSCIFSVFENLKLSKYLGISNLNMYIILPYYCTVKSKDMYLLNYPVIKRLEKICDHFSTINMYSSLKELW